MGTDCGNSHVTGDRQRACAFLSGHINVCGNTSPQSMYVPLTPILEFRGPDNMNPIIRFTVLVCIAVNSPAFQEQ